MRFFAGILLILGAIGLFSYQHFNLHYWMMKPEARVDMKWNYEVQKIEAQSNKIKTALLLLKDWQMSTTDQQFKDLIDKSHVPFHKSTQGRYTMKIQFMPWIEDMKYGYVIEHEIFDLNNNKVYEFSSNIEIGFLW